MRTSKRFYVLTLIAALAVIAALVVAGCASAGKAPKRSYKVIDSEDNRNPGWVTKLADEDCDAGYLGLAAWDRTDYNASLNEAGYKGPDDDVYYQNWRNEYGAPLWGRCENKKVARQAAPPPPPMAVAPAAPGDRDKDGIIDIRDQCPDVPGEAKYFGCPMPDRDKDTVADMDDDCPDTPGLPELRGCPRITQEERARFSGTIRGITFDTGKATIKPSSYSTLDDAVNLMKKYPYIILEIQGHTDSTGGVKTNKRLSQDRADSVKAYMVSKGVDGARIKTKGFGPDKPVADNKTAAGREQNRRIDFVIIEQ
ncbi:MAG: OmpA family protein [Myxococcales bacterium]|nr:MAG: OmpA family protein [Myxococcales bacterium]